MPSFILALGIFSYMVADILIFVGDYILHTDTFSDLSAFIFLLPNYFFGASVALYFFQKLKGRELYQFFANTLSLTVIGFIGLRKLLIFLGSYELLERGVLIRVYMYFTINLFILIMIGHMIVMIASETGFKGTNTMIIGILLYIILDVPYTYSQAIGNDPENIYTNLIYMASMILMAHGIYHQVHHHHAFKLKAYQYTERSARRTRIIVSVGIILSFVLFVSKTIEQNEFFYVVLAMAAYWITTSTFQNSALNEQILKQQDLLTGLYNRRYSATVLEESVRKANEQGLKFAILCIDLNSFKPINDTYGHDMGDRVLKEFGNRMLALPDDYTCFRTGGDEFMIVKDDFVGNEDLKEAARCIQKLFHTPIHLDTYIFSLSGSIGTSMYPDDSRDPEVLMRYADAAMYSVKHSQNKDDYRIFDVSLVASVEKHKALEDRMRKAEPSKDFVLHYQPRIDAKTGELTAVEVFPRLKGEEGCAAAELLPIAEEVGLMSRLGNWVMETSIRKIKSWEETYQKELSVSINISPLQLLDMDFVSNLKHVTAECGLKPSVIHLDISNDVIMGASITAKETLRSLKEYGFKLSLNDFGGYDINLSHVLNCGFSAIHISASLIKRAEKEESANILIRSIIALADTMGIKAYAVGVESAQQAEKLKAMGVDALQGFYFGKPEEADRFEEEHLR